MSQWPSTICATVGHVWQRTSDAWASWFECARCGAITARPPSGWREGA